MCSSTAPRRLPAIAEAIEAARSSVCARRLVLLARLPPARDDEPRTLRDLLGRVARARRRAGARLGRARRCRSSSPTAGEVRELRDALIARHARPRRARRARAADALPPREARDRRRRGRVRRRDRPDLARRRPPRHAASTRRAARSAGTTRRHALRGPAVADVADALPRCAGTRSTGEQLPAPSTAAGSRATSSCRSCARCPEKIYDALPRGEFSILEATCAALRSAERLIYLENQFLWSPEIVAVLADKLRSPPSDDFRLLVAAARPSRTTATTTRAASSGVLAAADGGAGPLPRLHAPPARRRTHSPSTSTRRSAIVDDRWLTIGSANLNEHSLFNDTEMNIVTRDAGDRARDAAAALERAPRARPVELDGDPRRSSTASGGRSPRSSSACRSAASR